MNYSIQKFILKFVVQGCPLVYYIIDKVTYSDRKEIQFQIVVDILSVQVPNKAQTSVYTYNTDLRKT